MADLIELAERCERGSGWDSALDKAIMRALGYSWRGMDYWHDDGKTIWKGQTCFTASLDATVALLDRVLPLAEWEVTTTGFKPGATVIPNGSKHAGAYATSPARALLAAILRALAAKETDRG